MDRQHGWQGPAPDEPLSMPSAKACALVFVTALTVRLVAMAATLLWGGGEAMVIEDSVQFMLEAQSYIDADTLVGFDPSGAAAFNPKIMPLISTLMALFGATDADSVWPFIAYQAVLDTLTCIAIGMTAYLLDRRTFVAVGLLAAFNPTMIVSANLLLSDTTCLFFYSLMILACVYLLSGRRGEKTDRSETLAIALGGIAVVGAIYTRFVSLHIAVFMLCVLIGLLIWKYRRLCLRRLPPLIVTAILAAAAIQPIALRNHLGFGEYTFSFQSGVHLLYWVVPMARDLAGVQTRHDAEEEARIRQEEMLGETQNSLSVFDRTDAMRTLGMEMFWETGIPALTKAWITGAALNIATPAIAVSPPIRAIPHDSFYDTPGDNGLAKVAAFVAEPKNAVYAGTVLISGLGVLVWLGLGGYGILYAARSDIPAVVFLLAWSAFILAITGPVVSPKYRLPLEPVWSVFAGMAIYRILHRWRG